MEGPPVSLIDDGESDAIDLTDRCWRDEFEDVWMTDFPPPPDFDGYESRDFDDVACAEPYRRSCTPGEAAVLDAGEAADRAAERAEEEDLRDCWFHYLRHGEDAADPAST